MDYLDESALDHYIEKHGLKGPKLREMDVRFGTWNIRSLYRADTLMAVTKSIKI
jgi:hypothetical protein